MKLPFPVRIREIRPSSCDGRALDAVVSSTAAHISCLTKSILLLCGQERNATTRKVQPTAPCIYLYTHKRTHVPGTVKGRNRERMILGVRQQFEQVIAGHHTRRDDIHKRRHGGESVASERERKQRRVVHVDEREGVWVSLLLRMRTRVAFFVPLFCGVSSCTL